MVVPVRDLVLAGVELGQTVLVVDLDAELVEFEVEDAHQLRPLVLVADACLHHAGGSQDAVVVDELFLLLQQVFARALLALFVLQFLQHGVRVGRV